MTCWHHGACRESGCDHPTMKEELVCLVKKRPNLSATELADLMALHSTRVSQVLKRMSAEGIIQREQGPRGRWIYRPKHETRRFKRTV